MKYIQILTTLTLLLVGCASSSDTVDSPNTASSNSTATISSSDTSSAEAGKLRGMTKAHNAVRQKHHLPALTWSPKLAAYAQQWADYLATQNHCVMQHRPLTGEYKRIYGENIFWASPRRWSDGRVEIQPITAEDVVFSWADEEQYYNYTNNSCKRGEICGHYTQLVWKNSKQVGCGMTICPDKGQMWVCSYDPPGNYIGEKPY